MIIPGMNLSTAVRLDIGRVRDGVHRDIIFVMAVFIRLDVSGNRIPAHGHGQSLIDPDVRIRLHRGIGHGIRTVIDLARGRLEDIEDEGSFGDLCLPLDIGMRDKVKIANLVVVFIRSGKLDFTREIDRLIIADILVIHLRCKVGRWCDGDFARAVGIVQILFDKASRFEAAVL